jgi:hypothetical protein
MQQLRGDELRLQLQLLNKAVPLISDALACSSS